MSHNLLADGAGHTFAVPATVAGMTDARSRPADGLAIQLSEPGRPGATRPPASGDPAGGQCRLGAPLARLCPPLRPDGAGVDRAGEAAAGLAVAGVLLGAL